MPENLPTPSSPPQPIEDEVVDLSGLEEIQAKNPQPKKQTSNLKAIILIFLDGLIVGGLITWGIFYLKRNGC